MNELLEEDARMLRNVVRNNELILTAKSNAFCLMEHIRDLVNKEEWDRAAHKTRELGRRLDFIETASGIAWAVELRKHKKKSVA